MLIDCDRCEARGLACASCSATAIVPAPGEEYPDLGPAEIRALAVLANAGMIPPLRFTPRMARASLRENPEMRKKAQERKSSAPI